MQIGELSCRLHYRWCENNCDVNTRVFWLVTRVLGKIYTRPNDKSDFYIITFNDRQFCMFPTNHKSLISGNVFANAVKTLLHAHTFSFTKYTKKNVLVSPPCGFHHANKYAIARVCVKMTFIEQFHFIETLSVKVRGK